MWLSFRVYPACPRTEPPRNTAWNRTIFPPQNTLSTRSPPQTRTHTRITMTCIVILEVPTRLHYRCHLLMQRGQERVFSTWLLHIPMQCSKSVHQRRHLCLRFPVQSPGEILFPSRLASSLIWRSSTMPTMITSRFRPRVRPLQQNPLQ